MIETPNIDELRELNNKLAALIEDPQPGVEAWRSAVSRTSGNTHRVMGRLKTGLHGCEGPHSRGGFRVLFARLRWARGSVDYKRTADPDGNVFGMSIEENRKRFEALEAFWREIMSPQNEPTLAGAPFHFSVPLLPPSVNHYKKPRRGGGWYRAADAIAFVDAVCLLSRKTKVTGNFYALELWFFLGPSKRNLSSNDVDNFQKVAIDALVRATVIKTDGRILDLHVHKRFVATDRQERTEYFVTGRQLDEGKVFPERELPAAVGRHTAAGSETA